MEIRRDVPLAPLTTMGVGGPAHSWARVESVAELSAALAYARERALASFVLGGGSNLVIADRGLDALVIRLGLRGFQLESDGDFGRLRVGAGEPWDEVVERAVGAGLAGLECLSGIPGDAGATPIQNVGAYGQEVADTIERVRAVEIESGAEFEFQPADCRFAYRDSFWKHDGRGRFIVTEVVFRLRRGPPEAPRYAELTRALPAGAPATVVRDKVIELRRAKSMVLEADPDGVENGRSCGSFFTNPIVDAATAAAAEARAGALGAMRPGEVMPRFPAAGDRVKLAAGWLIERAGLSRGTRHGRVGLSTRHALAVVNLGGAEAREVVAFARFVRDTVLERLGVRIVPEPELVGFEASELGDLIEVGSATDPT